MTWTQFKTRPVLLDVTVSKIGPGVTAVSPNSGSISPTAATTIAVTPNSIQSSALNPGYVYDVTELEIIPPVDSDGSFPDCEISFQVDNTDLSNIILIDASADGCMFPRRALIVGRRYVTLGDSFRDTMYKIANGQAVNNMPTRTTGLKVTSSVNLIVTSTAGWGQAAAAITPLRVIARGDYLSSADVEALDPIFRGLDGLGRANSRVFLTQGPSNPYVLGQFPMQGMISRTTWGALPGGTKQAAVKINRRFAHASNNQQIGTNGIFVFSNLQSLQGSALNVVDNKHDLGDDFSENNNAFLWTEWGVRIKTAGVSGYVGMRVNGEIIPLDTPQGTPVSYGVNDFQYGSVQPQRPESNLFYSLSESSQLTKLLVSKTGAAPFFSGVGNAAALAVGTVSMVKGGVLIEQH